MADRQHPPPSRPPSATVNSLLQKLREHSPNSTQLVGLATLVVSGGILLLLAGVTLTAAVLGLVFFAPLILITSPVWVPIGLLIFVSVSGFLSFFGLCVAAVATGAWMYRYFRGLHPVGSDRVDYARTRLVDTAGHVKDVAIEYGGYFQSKVKDAAPSA